LANVGGNKLFFGGYMFAEFDKVIRCLALELPESVHADVVAKYGKLKAEVEKFTSTNSAMDAINAYIKEYDSKLITTPDEKCALAVCEFTDKYANIFRRLLHQ
jgi:hypothetical protein